MKCNGQLSTRLEALSAMEDLFDDLDDVVFFVKDENGRYVMVNRTLVARCGLSHKSELVGHTTDDVFPSPLGEQYRQQDREVLETGAAITDKLELQLYPHGPPGWCLTNKVPIHGDDDRVVGMTGVSRDLHLPKGDAELLPGVSRAVDHIRNHYSERLRLEDLARMASLSVYQLEQRMKRIFRVTIGQFIMQTRINVARGLLSRSVLPIADVAVSAGFYDQSAFARQFKAVTGHTPREFRIIETASDA